MKNTIQCTTTNIDEDVNKDVRSAPMTAATSRILDRFPSVFLHKHDVNGNCSTLLLHPGEIVRHFSHPTRFKLIPLQESGEILEIEDDICSSRVAFWSQLTRWSRVAIFCETKRAFLSCKKKTYIPGLGDIGIAEYKTTIGPSEQFELERVPDTHSFTFRSHNGLYAGNNRALGGIIFRSESRQEGSTNLSQRAWEITPVLGFSSDDQRVKFVGVIDNAKRVVMELQETEQEEELFLEHDIQQHQHSERQQSVRYQLSLRESGNEHLRQAAHSVLGDILAGGLSRGESTHFRTHNGDCHYYVRDKRGVMFMVVVSRGFSRALAGECLYDLRAIYRNFWRGNRRKKGRPANKHEQRTRERINNELGFLVWSYNEHNESFRHHPVRRRMCDRTEEALDRVLDFQGNRRGLFERHKELHQSTRLFRKAMRKLRARQISKWTVAGAVWGGFVGGVGGGAVGLAVGGPVGAVVLGGGGAKLGALAVGSSVSVGVARCNTPLMWKNHVPSSNYGV